MDGDRRMGLIHACYNDLERIDGRSDWVSFIKCYFSHRGFRAVVYYRLARFFMLRGVRYLPSFLVARSISVTGADIPCQAEIGAGLLITHPVGVVIGGRVRIGKNCTIMGGVTLGELWKEGYEKQYPVIGDDVVISAGSKILGGVEIGDNVLVGANSVVVDSIPPNKIAAGVPARILGSRGKDDREQV